VSAATKLADAIDEFIDRIGRAVSWLALILALVMGANVLLRYGFSLGWIWTQELEWHILVPLALIGMSYALRHGEHVRVDVLFATFSARTKSLVDVIAAVISMALCVIVIRLSLPYIMQSWSVGEGSSNPGGIDARYIVKAFIPLGFALLFLQSLAGGIRSALSLRSS
jgi:TRAP-type mannitol/chloroaromatic compound transport system permease small subunit